MLLAFTLGFDRVWKRQLLRDASIRGCQRVADVACGTGIMTLLESDKIDPEGIIIGIDLSYEMISVATKKAQKYDNVCFVRAVAEYLPLADSSVDRITSCYLLKYSDRKKFFEEVHRVLREGGLAGSYEFSYPRGIKRVLTRFYIFALLPLLSKILLPFHRGLSRTLAFLADAIKMTEWESDVEQIIRESGSKPIAFTELSTGAAKLVVHRKEQR